MARKATKKVDIEEVGVEKGLRKYLSRSGFPNPEDMARKSDLVHRIDRIIRDRKLSQTSDAQQMGIDQSDLTKTLRGQFRNITLDKIFDMLSALGEDVTITVYSKPEGEDRKGRVMVAFG